MQSVQAKHIARIGSRWAIPSFHHVGKVSGVRVASRRIPPRCGIAPLFQRRSYATNKLDLPALDRKWRDHWKSTKGPAGAIDGKAASYILPMFPYPSGYLHLGHLRVYTITDVIARFRTLQGYNVLLPMGWDAFGLPAENAAIERGVAPAIWTKNNIAKMKEQLDMMNGSWDWSRELATCDPAFYKHTQKLFLMMHERGLAYQAEAEVNYDPVDKTVLANEQVDAKGFSWRSGAKVEKRQLKQWFFRISEFRDALLDDLEILAKDGAWPERVLAMQKNWLGKSNGATIKFPVLATGHDIRAAIEVFTTRPDTLFGVQYLALASTHPIVTKLAQNDPELQAVLDTIPGLPLDSKVGYMLPHLRAVNPLAYHKDTPDATKASIPVYVAPYVLGDYGYGAVMGVPGHDLRDNAFWKEHHYDEPVRIVLAASEDESTTAMANEPFTEPGIMTSQTGPYKGKSSTEAGKMLVSMLEQAELAKPVEKWRLRDWLISRQRYWGTPIPIVHCDSCGPVPVPDHQLPVELPEVDDHWAEGKAGNPLETAKDWINTSCPKCNGAAKRDTDTLDTFVDSSWYYARFTDPHNEKEPFSQEAAKLLPVDLYVGGIEHAILHLLYARFFYKFLRTTPLFPKTVESDPVEEPFRRLITQGMVHGKTYSDPETGRFLKPDEVDLTNPSEPKLTATGAVASVSFEKMSKSKHNGVDPTEFINQHGADATRAHMLFQAPVSDVLNWDAEKITGVTRWLGRLFEYVAELEQPTARNSLTVAAYFEKQLEKLTSKASSADASIKKTPKETKKALAWDNEVAIWRAVQDTIDSTTMSYEKVYGLNTIVSDLMSLTNTLLDKSPFTSILIRREAASAILRMLAPITPAFAEECWGILQPDAGSIFISSFPVTDGSVSILQPTTQSCAVQVNGKLRAVVELPTAPSSLKALDLQDWLVAHILETQEGQTKLIDGPLDIRLASKVIVVRGGKTVNFVLGGVK